MVDFTPFNFQVFSVFDGRELEKNIYINRLILSEVQLLSSFISSSNTASLCHAKKYHWVAALHKAKRPQHGLTCRSSSCESHKVRDILRFCNNSVRMTLNLIRALNKLTCLHSCFCCCCFADPSLTAHLGVLAGRWQWSATWPPASTTGENHVHASACSWRNGNLLNFWAGSHHPARRGLYGAQVPNEVHKWNSSGLKLTTSVAF